ncbi:MAG: hypothetical protein ABIK92_19965 [Pseudomonadota bacterium]
MENLYCWRCKEIIPMLDEDEWNLVSPLLTNMIQQIKDYRKNNNCSLKEAQNAVGNEACRKYFEITGYKETDHLALYHHRLSLYGPPCSKCGKPLRTPKAKLCAACGT